MEMNRSSSLFEEIDLEVLEDTSTQNKDLLLESIILFIISVKCSSINISFFVSNIIEKIVEENCRLLKSSDVE